VRVAREHQPEACVVVVTARAEDHGKALAEPGACIVADKPLDYEQFTKAITECQAHGGPGAHGRCHMRSRAQQPELAKLRRR
jgi:DNA-binding LytR/AlgR family response regulator